MVDTRLHARLRHRLRMIGCPPPRTRRTHRIHIVGIRLRIRLIRPIRYTQLHRVEVQRQLVSAAVHHELSVCIIKRSTRHDSVHLRGIRPMQGVAIVRRSVTRHPVLTRRHKLHLASRKRTRPTIYALRLGMHKHTILNTPNRLGSITYQNYLLGQIVCHQAHRCAQRAERKEYLFHTTSPVDEICLTHENKRLIKLRDNYALVQRRQFSISITNPE